MGRNLKELIQQAKSGEMEAMKQLVELYNERGDEASAAMWDAKAETGKYVAFSLLAMLGDAMSALGAEGIGAWDAAEESWRKVLDAAEKALQEHQSGNTYLNESTLKQAKDYAMQGRYGIALSFYMRDQDLLAAIQLLRKVPSSKAKALCGGCAMKAEDYILAYKMFKQVVNDQEYILLEKQDLEEGIFVDALNNLATIYRVGLPGATPQNLTAAVDVLTLATRSVRNEDMGRLLNVELSHYKKKLFGGYKYV